MWRKEADTVAANCYAVEGLPPGRGAASVGFLQPQYGMLKEANEGCM